MVLLLDNNTDFKARTKRGETALHFAAAAGHIIIIQALIEEGADVIRSDSARRTTMRQGCIRLRKDFHRTWPFKHRRKVFGKRIC